MTTIANAVRDGDLAVERRHVLRVLALAAVVSLVYSYVRVLHSIAVVVGVTEPLLALVAGALLVGTVVGRFVGARVALSVGGLLGLAGGALYLAALPTGWELGPLLAAMARDSLAHLTGVSILQLIRLDVWVLGVTPGPVFLTWYFAVRRRYAMASFVGGLTLGVFVLTADAGTVTTLVGLAAAVAAVGLGELERHEGTWRQLDVLAVVLALMVVATMLAPLGSFGASGSFLAGSGGGGGGSTATQTERVAAVGSISLSPLPTFNVTSDERHYWRVGAYDRYTSNAWVRTGGARAYEGPYRDALDEPPGETHELRQRFTARRYISAMPAAPYPVSVGDAVAEDTAVTLTGGLEHQDGLEPGDSYTVTSSVLDTSPAELRSAGTDYPDRVGTDYTQLPESTPDRVGRLAANVTANASTPYGKAVRIQQWLAANKNYSQQMDHPQGDMVAWFLFESDRGYCVYYASAMTVMLRSQGVPARFVLGYTSGERVADDRYVVRGFDSHAWVEVYFPDVGWVSFDPTPAGPRREAEQRLLERAGPQIDPENVALENPTPTPDPETPTPSDSRSTTNASSTPGEEGGFEFTWEWNWDWLPDLPTVTREQFALLGVALAGALAASHYTGRFQRARLGARLLWQGRQSTPRARVERAFYRLEALLERRYRPRRPGETPRAYLSALADHDLDDRVRRVCDLYERAHYGGRASDEEAAEAVTLVDELVDETPYGRLLWRSSTGRQ